MRRQSSCDEFRTSVARIFDSTNDHRHEDTCMPEIDVRFADIAADRRYKILCSLVIPRPIAMVTSMSEDGVVNAAPFSFFNVFGDTPPIIALGLHRRPDRTLKDTTANIHATREFVVNLVDETLAEAMNITAIDFPAQESEIEAANLALTASTDVKVPRIASAPAALECRWVHSVSFAAERELLLAEVVRAWTREGVMDDKFNVDFVAYQPVGRLYYSLYTRKPEVFEMQRIAHADWVKANKP
jgi:flavin reductase (DIM6/NTAB) family NADH-FMN oxidoreductase RutF